MSQYFVARLQGWCFRFWTNVGRQMSVSIDLDQPRKHCAGVNTAKELLSPFLKWPLLRSGIFIIWEVLAGSCCAQSTVCTEADQTWPMLHVERWYRLISQLLCLVQIHLLGKFTYVDMTNCGASGSPSRSGECGGENVSSLPYFTKSRCLQ